MSSHRLGLWKLLLVFPLVMFGQETNTISPPSGWESWSLTDECRDAFRMFTEREDRDIVNNMSSPEWYRFKTKTAVKILAENATCVQVETTGEVHQGWIASALLQSPTHASMGRLAASKKQAASLASLPTVNSGTPKVFYAQDRKCSEQFVQTLSMDGLEKRKKLAELVNFGCGFVDDSGLHVKREETQGSFCRVTPVEGKHAGASAWIACGWLK